MSLNDFAWSLRCSNPHSGLASWRVLMSSISEQFNQFPYLCSSCFQWIELHIDTTYVNLVKKPSLDGSGSSGVGEAVPFECRRRCSYGRLRPPPVSRRRDGLTLSQCSKALVVGISWLWHCNNETLLGTYSPLNIRFFRIFW